ncbi:craniofacial development protein 2 [Trichonephila inaurata madagascariensis]|uniref:Craniofacial development protein 2 n=1 Tax=Trichonephila inaurata madagascariensis TaxID=2747483 RepID=A0A8X6IK32_9ARAC|nr:craniofacial development protein 2 [Trichonephila inaurata madagascariensis]
MKSQTKDWFDEECAIANEKKNATYKCMIQARTRNKAKDYHNLRRVEKKIFRRKKVFGEDLFKDAEHLKSVNECRAFYQKINRNWLDFKQTNFCKNVHSEILTDVQDILKRWHEYFVQPV